MNMKKKEMNNFQIVLDKIRTEKKVSYMEAIVYYCENNDFEVEQAAKILSPKIKTAIRVEAEKLNLVKEKQSRLSMKK